MVLVLLIVVGTRNVLSTSVGNGSRSLRMTPRYGLHPTHQVVTWELCEGTVKDTVCLLCDVVCAGWLFRL